MNMFSNETTIKGNHIWSKSNQDVEAFYSCCYELSIIPVDVGFFFPNLKVLKIAFYRLETISREYFTSFKLLQTLNLRGNRIQDIKTDTFHDLRLLEKLNLEHNILEELDHELFASLRHLKHLSLSYNNLVYLPGKLFARNENLKNVLLSNNQIRYVGTETFERLKFIQEVDLRENSCIDFSYQFKNQTEQFEKLLTKCTKVFRIDANEAIQRNFQQDFRKLNDDRIQANFIFRLLFGDWMFDGFN